MPTFSVHPEELAESTKAKLNDRSYFYANSNAGLGWTDRANREAFYRWRIVPRMLVDTNTRDMTSALRLYDILPTVSLIRCTAELFGHRIPAPILFAPIGIQKLYSPTGELVPAKVAGELGLPYCLSTAGSQSIEDVAAANDLGGAEKNESNGVWQYQENSGQQGGPKGPRFFQLYMGHDDEIVRLCLYTRCVRLPYLRLSACSSGRGRPVSTCSCSRWIHGNLAGDLQISILRTMCALFTIIHFCILINGISSFYYSPGKTGNEIGESDPVFMRKYGDAQKNDTGKWIDSSVWHGKAHSWNKIPWLMEQWRRISGGRPFVLKGIQSALDAVKAAEIGCDGIVVSNHAGRQVDGAVGSLDMLPEIVEAVGDRSYPFLRNLDRTNGQL